MVVKAVCKICTTTEVSDPILQNINNERSPRVTFNCYSFKVSQGDQYRESVEKELNSDYNLIKSHVVEKVEPYESDFKNYGEYLDIVN